MPPNYRSYLVDPGAGANQGASVLNNAMNQRFVRDQQSQQSALAMRQADRLDRTQKFNERRYSDQKMRLSQQDQKEAANNELKMLSTVATTVGEALAPVTDEQSHQNYKQFLQMIGQNQIIGQNKLFQRILQDTPEHYDPAAQKEGLAKLQSLIAKKPIETAVVGKTDRLVNKGTGDVIVDALPSDNSDDKTNDIKEYEYAKANGYEGDFPKWMGSKRSTDKADLVQIGEKSYTLGALKGAYRQQYDIPDEISLRIMESSKNETDKKRAKEFRDRLADHEAFFDFIKTMQKKGKAPWEKGSNEKDEDPDEFRKYLN